MNSPVRLGVSPAASTPTSVFSQRFEALFSPSWNSGLRGLSCSPVVPPGLSTCKCGTTSSHLSHPSPLAAALSQVLSAGLPISAPSPNSDACFLFNSLVGRLAYNSIFWHFWLFFVFKFVVFLVV